MPQRLFRNADAREKNGVSIQALARGFGFSDEETDFLINYDIKYRMSGADEEA